MSKQTPKKPKTRAITARPEIGLFNRIKAAATRNRLKLGPWLLVAAEEKLARDAQQSEDAA